MTRRRPAVFGVLAGSTPACGVFLSPPPGRDRDRELARSDRLVHALPKRKALLSALLLLRQNPATGLSCRVRARRASAPGRRNSPTSLLTARDRQNKARHPAKMQKTCALSRRRTKCRNRTSHAGARRVGAPAPPVLLLVKRDSNVTHPAERTDRRAREMWARADSVRPVSLAAHAHPHAARASRRRLSQERARAAPLPPAAPAQLSTLHPSACRASAFDFHSSDLPGFFSMNSSSPLTTAKTMSSVGASVCAGRAKRGSGGEARQARSGLGRERGVRFDPRCLAGVLGVPAVPKLDASGFTSTETVTSAAECFSAQPSRASSTAPDDGSGSMPTTRTTMPYRREAGGGRQAARW